MKLFNHTHHPTVSEGFVPRKMVPAPVLLDPAEVSENRGNKLKAKEVTPTDVKPMPCTMMGTLHTHLKHEFILCGSRHTLNFGYEDIQRINSLHDRGVVLAGVEDPFTEQSRSWTREQHHNRSMGDRVISLFNLEDTCVAIWTCFWVPRVPKIRFMMLGSEFENEYNHGFPVEKQFSSVRFPMNEEDEELIEEIWRNFSTENQTPG